MKRIALILACCAAVAAFTLRPAEAEPNSLTIGSKAPALDIQHWIQDGNGKFKHVTSFEKDKVYVVEFWATWCGPCIQSMPHLAELQTKFRERDVQIVSVSDETVDEVEALLKQKHPSGEGSFAEITSAYTLTTDPDGSTHADYMEAAGQNGIPTSFIVGKSGLIEWIGHPAELEEPLEAVTADTWDREAFKEMLQRQKAFEEAAQKIVSLVGQGKLDEAVAMIDDEFARTVDEELKDRLMQMKNQLKLMSGKADEAVFAYYKNEFKEQKGVAPAIFQLAASIFGAIQQGNEVGPLGQAAIDALEGEAGDVEDINKPVVYNLIAQLYAVQDNLEQAIAAQEKAVKHAEPRQKQRLLPFLAELKEKLKGGDSEASGDEDK